MKQSIGSQVLTTGAVAELESQVGAGEAVDGYSQPERLVPARRVVVVQDHRVVEATAGLAASRHDTLLRKKSCYMQDNAGQSVMHISFRMVFREN